MAALAIAAASAIPAAATALFHPLAPSLDRQSMRMPELTPAAARGIGSRILWVDARPRAAYESGHISGAVLLNEDEWNRLLGEFLDAWEPGRAVVVYCDSNACESSQAVARRLFAESKIEPIFVLEGGWQAWHGFPR